MAYKVYTNKEVREIFGVQAGTVSKWAKNGGATFDSYRRKYIITNRLVNMWKRKYKHLLEENGTQERRADSQRA